ncbi:hypothetical protein CI238_13582 [Colletotrichum incanum]|uniref:Uncharacterized protein n=1 Tax=Colletotrichum incanum TaxID=1573173 RepID=A0A161X2X9_COLIC|nr:hypothetical protein CI238_13582 [Colletotrichum incanum]
MDETGILEGKGSNVTWLEEVFIP